MSESATARLLGLSRNRGHQRLYLLLSAIWFVGTVALVWGPLPGALVADNEFGTPTVMACRDVMLDYAQCVVGADAKANLIALLGRALVVLSMPVLFPLVALACAAVIDWVRAGYRTPS